jgi:hypothetical protein
MFSVWNPASRAFDYYQSPGQSSGAHAPKPPRAFGARTIGATVDQAAWRLPPGSVKVGAGVSPRGRIASLGSIGDDTLLLAPMVGLAAIIGVYLITRKKT